MPESTLDHIVITAPTLKSGVEWVRDTLDATPEFGGTHPQFATHNCLLSLGGQTYLEVIAPDPNAAAPERPRLFDLDHVQRTSDPRLAAWVARTTDIKAVVSACSEPPGTIEPMSRGELNWLITLTRDGSLTLDGTAPILIEWPPATHPSTAMRETGCRLLALELHHPDSGRVARVLKSIGFESDVDVKPTQDEGEPFLVATIHTARGEISLSKP